MHVVAVQAAEPVLEEGSAAHALCVRDQVERRGSVRETGGLNVDDFLAGRDDRRGCVGETDFV